MCILYFFLPYVYIIAVVYLICSGKDVSTAALAVFFFGELAAFVFHQKTTTVVIFVMF
jgi:hypothetical protein